MSKQSERRVEQKKKTNKTRKTFLLRGTNHTNTHHKQQCIDEQFHNQSKKELQLKSGTRMNARTQQMQEQRRRIKREPFLHIF